MRIDWNKKEEVLAAVKKDGDALLNASCTLRADRDIVMEAVQESGYALQYASLTLRADRDIVMAAVQEKGYVLQYASDTLRADRDIVMAAVKENSFARPYASYKLQNDIIIKWACSDKGKLLICDKNFNYEEVEALYKNQTFLKLATLSKSFNDELDVNKPISALKNLDRTACVFLSTNGGNKFNDKTETKMMDA